MSARKTLAQTLKEVRIKAGLSQREVADTLGYSSAQFISNWERGVSHPPINSLKKIALALNCSADFLFETLLQETIETIRENLKQQFINSQRSKY